MLHTISDRLARGGLGHRSQLWDVIPHIKGSVRAQQRVGNICDSRDPGCSLTDFFLWCHYLQLATFIMA
ncbi:hypothetical protein INR49_030229 [Caranx melampygus]|nr:hypothetical protein INR49_030229 [Caranx melampygus]